MKIAWTKLIWEVVVVGIVVALVVSHWPEKKSVVAADKPYMCTGRQFEAGECDPPTEPVNPPVVVVPVPSSTPPLIVIEKPVSPPVVRHAPKSRVKHLSCSQVPSIAYNFSLNQVLSTAKGRGLTQLQLADLTACWEKHHG